MTTRSSSSLYTNSPVHNNNRLSASSSSSYQYNSRYSYTSYSTRGFHNRANSGRRTRSRSPGMAMALNSNANINVRSSVGVAVSNEHVPPIRHFYPQPHTNQPLCCTPPPTYGSCQRQPSSSFGTTITAVNDMYVVGTVGDCEPDGGFETRSTASTPPPSYESCYFESLPNVPFSNRRESRFIAIRDMEGNY
ncbi:unnamed protein product [Orchesella dallaii]|uniref:Uncharacterized protein n=1 Tax=Orchesella dallaii TaxID=48710 RepID=A0ABP1QGJ0_9HEXA